jgi:hypothetical protein
MRVEIRHGKTDAGALGRKPAFIATDIGASAQEVLRHTQRDVYRGRGNIHPGGAHGQVFAQGPLDQAVKVRIIEGIRPPLQLFRHRLYPRRPFMYQKRVLEIVEPLKRLLPEFFNAIKIE